ncbi:MAG: IPT/TIG domain-containing protein [Bdellovibrionia bacterium]
MTSQFVKRSAFFQTASILLSFAALAAMNKEEVNSHVEINFLAAAPVITTITPATAVVGSDVQIQGKNFGKKGSIRFGGIIAQSSKWASNSIVAIVPQGTGTVQVFVKTGRKKSNTVDFTYSGTTPSPTPSPAPSPTPKPSPAPSPTPKPSPAPSPTPKPSPTPLPSPTPKPSPTPLPSPTPKPSPTPVPSPLPLPTPSPNKTSSGKIYFHVFPALSASTPLTSTLGLESLDLLGERYTDLIISNYISGVILGHALQQTYPGLQFNKDYLYGTMFAQLLQENINTAEYNSPSCPSSSKTLAPCPDQAAVMAPGQGGPYQINAFAYDLIYGLPSTNNNPGFSLLNYVAIQQNISLTFTQLGQPFGGKTPDAFNDLYFGPALTAFFHLNDVSALIALGQTAWTPPVFAKHFATCLNNLKAIPNAPFDILVNYAYNQGFYGRLMAASTELCANNVNSFVTQSAGTSANPYANAISGYNNGFESNTSYTQYPYQVRFYLDQLYNKSTLLPKQETHTVFNTATLGTVFSNIFGTFGSLGSAGIYSPPATILATSTVIAPSSAAMQAYNEALRQVGITAVTLLDLSDSSQRAVIFTILEKAISNLELSTKATFSQKTATQLSR